MARHTPRPDPPAPGNHTHLLTAVGHSLHLWDSHPHCQHQGPHKQKSFGFLDPPSEDQVWSQCIIHRAQNANSVIKFHYNGQVTLKLWLMTHCCCSAKLCQTLYKPIRCAAGTELQPADSVGPRTSETFENFPPHQELEKKESEAGAG